MKTYRLLDIGEATRHTDEFLDRHGEWKPVILPGEVTRHWYNPVRREDDGRGEYIISHYPEASEFYHWGNGWMVQDGFISPLNPEEATWRKKREVTKNEPENWCVISDGCQVAAMLTQKTAIELAKKERQIRSCVVVAQVRYRIHIVEEVVKTFVAVEVENQNKA